MQLSLFRGIGPGFDLHQMRTLKIKLSRNGSFSLMSVKESSSSKNETSNRAIAEPHRLLRR
jgi:hypothetical protein